VTRSKTNLGQAGKAGFVTYGQTLTWEPKATEQRETPEVLEEGWTEVQADGWWTRAYSLDLPASILTNWAAPLLAGDEAMDVSLDIAPQDGPVLRLTLMAN